MKNSLTLRDFPVRSTDKLRYSDTDRQGHVNNAVFSTFLETGRLGVLLGYDGWLAPKGASFVIAHLELNFRAEIQWPGHVDIGTGVTAIGRSSVRLRQAIFQNGCLVASAETVIVLVNDASRRSEPLPSSAIERLGRSMIPLATGDPPQAD